MKIFRAVPLVVFGVISAFAEKTPVILVFAPGCRPELIQHVKTSVTCSTMVKSSVGSPTEVSLLQIQPSQQKVMMKDNGQQGDEASHDGLFTGTLSLDAPAGTVSLKVRVKMKDGREVFSDISELFVYCFDRKKRDISSIPRTTDAQNNSIAADELTVMLKPKTSCEKIQKLAASVEAVPYAGVLGAYTFILNHPQDLQTVLKKLKKHSLVSSVSPNPLVQS